MQLPAHVEWLLPRIGPDLHAAVRRQGVDVSAPEILATLCEADPTPRKHAVQWMAERIADGGLSWEDVRSGRGSRAYGTLEAFWAHRRVLAGDSRHLTSHRTLAAVRQALVPPDATAGQEPGIRERRRQERTEARRQSVILCERPGLTVAVPLTEGASRWWGRGTRWCTASDEDNAFNHYNASGPLVVLVLPEGKMQMFVAPDREAQFKDADGKPVEATFVHERWADLGPVVAWAVRGDPAMLRFAPPALREAVLHDRAACLRAVTRSGLALEAVPEALQDDGIRLAAVSQNWKAIKFVPEALRDRDLWIAAIRQKPGHLVDGLRRVVLAPGVALKIVDGAPDLVLYLRPASVDLAVWRSVIRQDPSLVIFMPDEARYRKLRIVAACRDAIGVLGALVSPFSNGSRGRKAHSTGHPRAWTEDTHLASLRKALAVGKPEVGAEDLS